MDCVFCKIVSGDIPSFKVYEDAHTLVFMDIARDVDAHMVAIPKNHRLKRLPITALMLVGMMG